MRSNSKLGYLLRLRLALLIVFVVAVASAFIFFPWGWRNRPMLRLFLLDSVGRFDTAVAIPRAWADTVNPDLGDAGARIPLILAVSNSGRSEGAPTLLRLSIPARFRLLAGDGTPVASEPSPGNPLTRYNIPIAGEPVLPGRLPDVVPGLDTLWLEPLLPQFYCVTLGDSVPSFMPAPAADPRPVSRAEIFYSFEGEDIRTRQTGVVGVRIDTGLVRRPPPPSVPVFPTEIRDPEQPMPELGELRGIGSRTADCGDPEQPMQIVTHQWETPNGGRFFVIEYGGAPRRYMFDLNRDSIIELEMWDANSDGRFEARRAARMPIPPFLFTVDRMRPLDPRVFAGLSPDSLLKLEVFGRTRAEPYVLRTRQPDSVPSTERFRQAIAFEPARPRPLPEFGPQFRYEAPATSAQPGYERLPAWGPQYQPGPLTATPQRTYVPLPPWGPQYQYTRPRREPQREEGPRLLGVPVEEARQRAAPRQEPTRAPETTPSQPPQQQTPEPEPQQQEGAPQLLGEPVDSVPR